ncbi:MAG TPA: FadR/GntR family transcriptional regulator [Anaeromyxobacter sp.]|nr:FadR/GntR family transcriptional regulator [Anaeromyxobacter sp.]
MRAEQRNGGRGERRDADAPPPGLRGLEAIRRPRLSEEIARQLQAMIGDGRFKPGDRLPPERELVRRFQVSRGSVRDAIQALGAMGLVRSRQGEGTTVQGLSADLPAAAVAAPLLPPRGLVRELLEIRKIIEPAFAARAAVHATPEEIAALEDVLVRQREKCHRRESTIEEDSEFHYLLAMASGIGAVSRVVDVLMDLTRESRARSLQIDGRLERSIDGHARIVRAIQRRSPKAAEVAMRRHLAEIGSLLLGRPAASA